ncbi:MAG TPA: hypothetical protein VGC65_04985 [Bacteroidia bacterium]|jgi:hypothetical protein
MLVFKKIATVFLAVIFLFSSLGFTISSMVCLKSGKGKISLSALEDCCSKKQTVPPAEDQPGSVIKKGDCCAINNYTIKLTDFQAAQKTMAEQPAVFSSLFLPADYTIATSAKQSSVFLYSDLPPPLYGRQLLSFISTLVI